MAREIFDYDVVRPDKSVISIRKGRQDPVAYYVWDNDKHIYKFKGVKEVDQEELQEIFKGLLKLNKKSILPSWLKWGNVEK